MVATLCDAAAACDSDVCVLPASPALAPQTLQHSHLLSMVLGNSETVPVTQGKLALGTWQSVMLVELDGARKRTVGVQVTGVQG